MWIIIGIVLIAGLITGIYFFTKSNSSSKSPNTPTDNPSNIQYLPSEEEAQTKIQQIKSSKNLDDQQATIEFLTSYVPEIKWWEINSLQELDEKIKLVNNKTGFPPFKEVPKVDKFNQTTESNFNYKKMLLFASVIPREVGNTIDWKGIQDWNTYYRTILYPQLKDCKYKSSFATQKNYQELGRRLKEEINSLLSSLCSQFATLNNVSDLNTLTDNYLSKIFQGYIYAHTRDDLEEQLAIMPPQSFQLQKTGNSSENGCWKIALNEFGFKNNKEPNPDIPQNPDSPINPPSNNPKIKQLQDQAEEIRQLLKPCETLFNSFEQVKKNKEEEITQLEAKKQNLDSSDREYNIKSMDIQTEISKIEHAITMVGFKKDDLEKIKKEVNNFEEILANCIKMNKEHYFDGHIPRFQKSFPECKIEFPSLKKALEDFCNS